MNQIPNLTPRDIAELLHELRTPLGGLRAMCDVIERGHAPDAMAALRASIDHLEAIAGRVLSVEPAASMEVQPLRMTVKAVFAQLSSIISPQASAKCVTFTMHATPTAEAVEIEAVPFRQVLENLIGNALRLQNGGALEIVAHCQMDGRLAVVVRDEGPGISEADARRLIARGGAVAGRKGGAGLGLSICGKLVGAHHGALSGGMRSDGLPGAEFRFDWPGYGGAESTDAAVLIVDDHPASRQVLRTILAHLGVPALEADGVEPALSLLARREFRLVMTDLRMDDGGGNRLIETLKQTGYAGKIAVVSADQPDLPVDAFVMKPISVKAIVEMLRQTDVLDRTEAA